MGSFPLFSSLDNRNGCDFDFGAGTSCRAEPLLVPPIGDDKCCGLFCVGGHGLLLYKGVCFYFFRKVGSVFVC